MVLTSSPVRLAPVSEGPRFRSAVPVNSGPCPIARGVDQLSRVTRALVRGPVGMTNVPDDSRRGPRDSGFDQLSRATLARSRGVDQLSWMTRTRVRVLKVSTTCSGLFQ